MAGEHAGGKPDRKPTKKRATTKPTKAAALKALGLTQKDLDYIKESRKPTNTEPEAPQVVESGPVTLTPAEQVERTYSDDYQGQLENRPAPEVQETNLPEPPREQEWYVRNLRGMEFRFRLERNREQTQKAIVLKPRGQRADMQRLQKGDLYDDSLRTNVGLGIIEIIPEGEAIQILEKQSTNAQQPVHGPLAMLRSETGKEYEPGSVTVASDLEANGVKVADLDPRLMQGKLTDREVRRDGGFAQAPMGGNPAIISDGFAAAREAALAQGQQPVPVQTDQNLGGTDAKAMEVDALARQKNLEGPGAGLGRTTVVVEPTQRS